MRKIFTLDDLQRFYEGNGENASFSSKESGYQLAVHIPASVSQFKDENDDGRLLKCKVKICHSGLNRNKSSLTDEALEKAAKGLAYKPVLANFCELTDDDGNTIKDFTSHDMIFNEDGTTTYLEHQVGCFTTDKPYIEKEAESGNNFLYGTCVIPYEYTPAAEIITRKNGTKVSVELAVNELQYKDKVLELTDVDITGVTLLGTNPETGEPVEEGMKNARLDIYDFSRNDKDNYIVDEKLIQALDRLNYTLSNLNTQPFEEGGQRKMKFDNEEIIEKPEDTVDENQENDNESSNTDEATPELFSLEFKLSHDDIRVGLYTLLSAFESADNEYYCINAVYDDSFVYQGWSTGKLYGQKYSKDKNDSITFDGERYELFAEYLTADEKSEIDTMRENYNALVEFKKLTLNTEARANKISVLTDDKYSLISKKDSDGNYINKDFEKLIDNIDSFSIEQLEREAKVILADCLVSKFNLDENTTPTIGKKLFTKVDKPMRSSRYGSIFKQKK